MKALLAILVTGIMLLVVATVYPSIASPYIAVVGAVVAAGSGLLIARRAEGG